MMKVITASIALALAATGAQAQLPKDKEKLSEQCDKQAAERFAKDWVSSHSAEGHLVSGNYKNHYNFRLNKCFYLEVMNTQDRAEPPYTIMTLYDLNGSLEIASYSKVEGVDAPSICVVQDKKCKSEQEWRSLLKPFMED